MKIKAFLAALAIVPLMSFAQGGNSKEFNQAKLHLANHKLSQAIPILENLWRSDPRNANLNYLLGLCYVKEDHDIPQAVELLETASSLYSSDYAAGSNRERRAPEYVYYYLTIAYSKNGQCEEALRSLNKFYQVYTYNDEYYLVDGQKWVRECNLEKKEPEIEEPLVSQRVEEDKPLAVEPEPASVDTMTEEEIASKEIIEEAIQERKEPQIKERLIPFTDWDNLVTRDVSFSSMTSQYGVQVAALIDLKPTRDFGDLKNIEVYVDENGIFRYVIGRFVYRQQAESLLEKIRERGYKDAFIVDVNQPDYNKEVIGLGKSNINWHLQGKVDFRVQIGAFTTIVPGAVAEKYLEVDGIKENRQNELTILTVGSFPAYDEAADYREQLKALGIEDAFVVAFNMGNKVPLKEAKEYVDGVKPKTEPSSEAEYEPVSNPKPRE
ncbi:MAG: hypothetical protein R2813_11665 [Flavobacteriales bacterium]